MAFKVLKKSNLFRKIFAILLCLFTVLQGFVPAFAANQESAESDYCAYEWTRINSKEELMAYYEEGTTDQDAWRYFNDDPKNESNPLGNDDPSKWFKVLIAYDAYDGGEYFLSGSSMINDGESIAASRVLPTYFYDENGNQQHIGDEKLNSTSGLFAPYIRFAGYDGSNPTFYIRLAEADTSSGEIKDVMGPQTIIGNHSWYGVKGLAYGYSELRKTYANNPSGYTRGAACSHTTYTRHTMIWNDKQSYFEPETFRVKLRQDYDGDRYWTYPDKDYEVRYEKDPDYIYSDFYLYIGAPAVSKVINQASIAEPTTTTINTAIITESALYEVPKGACVIMEGLSKVNGSILVNGGTLIIKGTLDTSDYVDTHGITDAKKDALSPGSIRVTNGGTLYVEDTGVLCLRLPTSNLIAEKGSVIRIDGGCAVAGKIKVTESNFVVGPGAALIHGAKIPELYSPQAFGKAGIAQNKELSLDYFLSDAFISYDRFLKNQGTLEVGSKGYFYVYGMYYQNRMLGVHGDVTFDSTAVVSATAHTNIHAKISEMMTQW